LAEILQDPKIIEMNVDELPAADQPPVNKRKKPDLTSEERRWMIRLLLLEGKEGPLGLLEEQRNPVLKRGALSKVAGKFGVDPSTASRIWKEALKSNTDDTKASFQASPKKKGRCGRPQKWNRDDVRQAIMSSCRIRMRSNPI
jgi:hypothetical protein